MIRIICGFGSLAADRSARKNELSVSALLRSHSGGPREVMESIATTLFTSALLRRRPPITSFAPRSSLCTMNLGRVDISNGRQNLRLVSSDPFAKAPRHLFGRVQAAGSGLETSIADAAGSSITLKKVKISVKSQTESQIELRVDVIGEETDRVLGQVLTNLARTAPPIPGFRRQKGGWNLRLMPSSFMLLPTIVQAYLISWSKPDRVKFSMSEGALAGKTTKVLGEERVLKFAIQEIVTSTVANYVKTEKLNVKENKVSTSQSMEELKSSFNPGKDFAFNAVMELQSVEALVQDEVASS